MPLKDKNKRKKYHDAYSKQWYQKRKELHKKKQFEHRNKRRKINIIYINEEKNKPCVDCNKKYPFYVMHFDHLPGTRKVAQISNMTSWGIEKIKKEIKKCDLICANCHHIRTYKRTQTRLAQRTE